jgi:hypothetical protein
MGLLYRACGAPRHEIEEGGAASAEEKGFTASSCPPAHGEDEDDLLRYLDEEVWAVRWAGADGLLLGCCWAPAWACVRPLHGCMAR